MVGGFCGTEDSKEKTLCAQAFETMIMLVEASKLHHTILIMDG